MYPEEQKLYNSAFEIVKKIQGKGFIAYFVGGCVRDKLLEKHIQDIDIATSALPAQIRKLFDKTYDIGAAFGIINVVYNGFNFEVATFRKEDAYKDGRRPGIVEYTVFPEHDAQRRDFTINALFYDPVKETLYDYFNGLEDLKKGIVRCIGDAEKRFLEDHLRMLRAIRFGLRFNFKISDEIINNIKKHSAKLKFLSAERVREELNKILLGPHPDEALQLMHETKMLNILLPEIEFLIGVRQPEEFHPEGDVFSHIKLMLSRMAYPSVELAWSILLHDIGKPCTIHIDAQTGRPRFYCHEAKGCEIADFVLRRLKFSNDIRRQVCIAVRNHMRFAHVTDMRKAKWQRLLTSKTFPLELELHRLDSVCSSGKIDGYLFLLDKLVEFRGRHKNIKPILNGSDLIEFGIKPGPLFKEFLQELKERQLAGEIVDKDSAIKFVKSFFLKDKY